MLFKNANYVTDIVPEFRKFLQWFLPSGTPSGDDNSICGASGIPASPPVDPNAIIVSDSGNLDSDGFFNIDAEVTQKVSQVLVEYGLDLSTPLKPVLIEKGYEPSSDEYLYLLGGDVAINYDNTELSASWDQNFYFLNITGSGTFEALYVFDQGDGSKKIPAMYFPPEKREDVANLQFLDFLFFDFEYWVDNGARFSFLKVSGSPLPVLTVFVIAWLAGLTSSPALLWQFSVDEAEGRINNNLALYTANNAGAFSEQPRSAGGLLIPLIYIDAYIQGRKLDTLPGGFNQTVIEWTENLDYNILTVTADRIFDVIPNTDACVINMYAYNHGKPAEPPEARYYDVIRPDRGGGFSLSSEGGSGGSSSPNPGAASGSASVSTAFAVAMGFTTLLLGAL